MATLGIPLSEFQAFFLTFLRVAAILTAVPVFESRNVPVLLKGGLSLAVALMLFPMVRGEDITYVSGTVPFGVAVAGEILLGLIIGFSVRLILAGIQLAGQYIGFQMGFGVARVLDPEIGAQVSIIAQFKNLIAILIFLSINAHHFFIRGMVESFHMVPPLNFQLNGVLMENIIKMGGNMFIIAFKVGAPVMAALFLVSVAFGLVARAVPQVHILIVAFPVKIGIGLLMLGFSLPYFVGFLKQVFGGLENDILLLLRSM